MRRASAGDVRLRPGWCFVAKWAPVALIIATLVVVWAVWSWGVSTGRAQVQAQWEIERAANAITVAALEKRYREQEKRWARENQQLADELHRVVGGTVADLEATLSDVRDDNLRLREQFRGCQSRVPGTPSTPSSDDGARQGGLSYADEEFLIRISAEADVLVHKLTACQAYVSALQGDDE